MWLFKFSIASHYIFLIIGISRFLIFYTSKTKRYKLKTKGQKAAYIANMAYEGGYLQYNHNLVNHSQGSKLPYFFVLFISP